MLCLAPRIAACLHCACCTFHGACTRAGPPQVRRSACCGTASSILPCVLFSSLKRSMDGEERFLWQSKLYLILRPLP